MDAARTLLREPETNASAVTRPMLAAEGGMSRGFAFAPSGAGLAEMVRPAAKRAMDIAGAATLLLLCLPVFLALAALVRMDGGSAFYAHPRVGRGGRLFGCLKFRSMVVDSDRRLAELLERDPAARAEWDATRKLRHDPRVTWVGRFLRATSLDELPQLINVVKGEMSLVGPRPVIMAELTTYYGAAAGHYLAVRPGLTGPWQVSGRSDTSYAQRVALDVGYVTRPSLLTDVKILLRTPLAVIARRGAY
jgi:lipopolysaccharide/colanic/teichoic acid biosynthesis glycosyltransferase